MIDETIKLLLKHIWLPILPHRRNKIQLLIMRYSEIYKYYEVNIRYTNSNCFMYDETVVLHNYNKRITATHDGIGVKYTMDNSHIHIILNKLFNIECVHKKRTWKFMLDIKKNYNDETMLFGDLSLDSNQTFRPCKLENNQIVYV